MKFGTYGTEPNTLILVYRNGGLEFKYLNRKANLQTNKDGGPPIEQNIPLQLPKKTKLYLEQANREKQYATEMHRAFQKDLCKLRLQTTRAYVKILTDGQQTGYSDGSSINLNAEVCGFGPLFNIKLTIQNTGTKPLHNLPVILHYNRMIYQIDNFLMTVSAMIVHF